MDKLFAAAGDVEVWKGDSRIKPALQKALNDIGIEVDFKDKSILKDLSTEMYRATGTMNNIAKSNDKTGTINSQKQFVTYLENFKD
jgi:hypothetical protein